MRPAVAVRRSSCAARPCRLADGMLERRLDGLSVLAGKRQSLHDPPNAGERRSCVEICRTATGEARIDIDATALTVDNSSATATAWFQ